MSDISVRIPCNDFRKSFLENNSLSKKLLPVIKDTMYKPVGVSLSKYHPNEVCLRLREFEDNESSLVEIKTIKKSTGYSDEKKTFGKGKKVELKKIASDMYFEKWGEMSVISTEYQIKIKDKFLVALLQNITPVGEFIKIESEAQEALDSLLVLLKVSNEEKIERNAAVLLAEHLGLIPKP